MVNHPVPAILFCPKVIYNRATELYVLWYNWLPVSRCVMVWGVCVLSGHCPQNQADFSKR